MKQFTSERDASTPDELWVVQHYPVYTQGQAGKPEHLLTPSPTIPIIQSDRGGQITYHGPGQLVIYVLLDLHRRHLSIRCLVTRLEQAIIHFLRDKQIIAESRKTAPGVYINHKKICSIGLRIKRGCSYHGLAFNVDMDLTPFNAINPCGYQGLIMTQLKEHYHHYHLSAVKTELLTHITHYLNDEQPTVCI